MVCDFVYPAYFQTFPPARQHAVRPSGKLQKPVPAVLDGGYISAFDVNGPHRLASDDGGDAVASSGRRPDPRPHLQPAGTAADAAVALGPLDGAHLAAGRCWPSITASAPPNTTRSMPIRSGRPISRRCATGWRRRRAAGAFWKLRPAPATGPRSRHRSPRRSPPPTSMPRRWRSPAAATWHACHAAAGGCLGPAGAAGPFDLGMAHLWWSHLRKQDRGAFLAQFAAHLEPGATLLMIDENLVANVGAPIVRRDAEGIPGSGAGSKAASSSRSSRTIQIRRNCNRASPMRVSGSRSSSAGISGL